jgi:hypothetical protein
MTPENFAAELVEPPEGHVIDVTEGPSAGYLCVTITEDDSGRIVWSALETPDVDLPIACFHVLQALEALD